MLSTQKVNLSVFYYRNMSENSIFWHRLNLPTGVKPQHKKMYLVEEILFITGNIHFITSRSRCHLAICSETLGWNWQCFLNDDSLFLHMMVGFRGFFSPFLGNVLLSRISLSTWESKKIMGVLRDWSLAFGFLSLNILCTIRKENIQQTFLV